MPTKSLENLLNPSKDGELGDIIRRARDMGALTDAIKNSLPPDYGAAILAANVRDETNLVVICQSSAWASRLRFEKDRLLEAARSTGARVEDCSVRVSRHAG